jgi:hypothetical protein
LHGPQLTDIATDLNSLKGIVSLHCIDTKFKVFRIRFIFDFKIFIKNFLKMAPIRVRFSPGFLQEQDFPGSNLIRADTQGEKNPVFRGAKCSSVALEVRRSTPLRTANPLEQPPWKIRPGEELLRSSRSMLEQIPPREILVLEEIPG